MEIHSGKETIERTEKNIPELVGIIQTKKQEIQNILTQENEKSPLNLRGRAYETFQKIRKEILATLHVLDTLGYTYKEGQMRKTFKSGPFIMFKNIDCNSPKTRREILQLIQKQKEILKAAEVDINELRKIQFTI